jgi:hypothetical protein
MERLKRFLGYELPTFEISPEREEEIINRVVETVRKSGMVLPASFFLYGFEPMSTIFSHMFMMPAVPFLELLGLKGYELTAFLMKKENIKRLNERLAKLREEREKEGFWGK